MIPACLSGSPARRRGHPEPAQRGFVLLTVLMVGLLVLIVGAATVWLLKQNIRQTGKQRKDFQAMHAAEGGIKYFQNRLNLLPLCHAWFAYLDSMAIVGTLGSITMAVPTPYGAQKGFRIRNAQVVPNGNPVRVRFESAGGKLLPDGSLDTANGRPVVCDMRMRTMGDFIFFVEQGSLFIGDGALVQGKVYAGLDVSVEGRVDFQKLVNYGRDLLLTGSDPTQVVFREGFEKLGDNPYNLDHIHVPSAELVDPCGPGMPHSYQQLAMGAIANERRGFFYIGPSKALLVVMDSLRYASGTVRFKLYEFDSTKADLMGPLLMNTTMPLSQFNGVVYLDGDVFVKGNLSNISVTITSTDDILAVDNTLCLGSVVNSDRRVTLGLIAQDKVFIWGKSPTHTTLEAALIAEDDALYAYGGFDQPLERSFYALGDTLSHPGTDAGGAPASNLAKANWVLTVRGSIINRLGATAGPWYFKGGTRIYEFDPDNVYSPPPKFPIIHSSKPGASLWEVTGWNEK